MADDFTLTTGTSTFHSFVSIVKCIVGAGSFFLPYGFKKAGLWGGIVGLLCLGILCDYINLRVIRCKRKLFGRQAISYPDLARATFGAFAGKATYVFILIQGLGACAVYAVFCGDLLHAVVGDVDVKLWIVIIGVTEILLSWIKTMTYVAFTSVLGDIAVVLGVIVVFVFGFKDGGFIDSPLNFPALNIETYPQFIGTAAFLFSITMYLFPIESSMKHPQRFNMSLHIGFIVTTIGNIVFAAFAYMFFGDAVKDIVINNLGKSIFVTLARIALVVDLVFTFVVVFVPCRDVVEQTLLASKGRIFSFPSPLDRSRQSIDLPINTTQVILEDNEDINSIDQPNEHLDVIPHWKKMLVRTVMILITMGFAVAIPNVSDLVGIVVGVSNSMNSFILPTLIYLKVSFDEDKQAGVYDGIIHRLKNQKDEEKQYLKENTSNNEINVDDGSDPTGMEAPQHHCHHTTTGHAMTVVDVVKLVVHWVVHVLIVVLGIAAGILTTVQAIQTVVSDYT